MEAKEEKPRRCPFCGSEVDIGKVTANEFYIHCTNSDCGVQPKGKAHYSKEKAIEAWNKRG